MARVTVCGASLEFAERGTGDPVVLVHGSVSDYRTWSYQQAELGRHFRAIAYSRRYHWPNDPIPQGADYSMIEQVEDLESLLRVIEAEPAHVVGHSYGAYLALLLAIRSPRSVRSLVLAEPPILPLFISIPPKPQELLTVLLRRPRAGTAIVRFLATGLIPATVAFKRGDTELGLRRFGTVVLGQEAFGGLSAERLEQVRANLIKAEFLGSYTPLTDEEVAGVRQPILLLQGEHSPSLFGLLLDRLQELVPAAWREEIPGASHIMHEDNPGAFLERVVEFLRLEGAAA